MANYKDDFPQDEEYSEEDLLGEFEEEDLGQVLLQGMIPFQEAPNLVPEKIIEALKLIDPNCCENPTADQNIYNNDIIIKFEEIQIYLSLANGKMSEEDLYSSMIDIGLLTDEEREELINANAFVLIIIDGEETEPIEHYIAFLKTAFVLIKQGGLGIINPCNGTVSHRDLLEIFENQEADLWEELRVHGSPPDLLTGYVIFEGEDCFWMTTCGQHFFEMPEFVANLGNELDEKMIENVEELFQVAFMHFYMEGLCPQAWEQFDIDNKTITFLPSSEQVVELPSFVFGDYIIMDIKEA